MLNVYASMDFVLSVFLFLFCQIFYSIYSASTAPYSQNRSKRRKLKEEMSHGTHTDRERERCEHIFTYKWHDMNSIVTLYATTC